MIPPPAHSMNTSVAHTVTHQASPSSARQNDHAGSSMMPKGLKDMAYAARDWVAGESKGTTGEEQRRKRELGRMGQVAVGSSGDDDRLDQEQMIREAAMEAGRRKVTLGNKGKVVEAGEHEKLAMDQGFRRASGPVDGYEEGMEGVDLIHTGE